MLKATLTLPKFETKKVWAGLYGGHFDVIVFFRKKPKATFVERKVRYIDCLEEYNNKNIIGDMFLGDFRVFYPDADLTPYTQSSGRPKAIEIPSEDIFQIELTTMWDDYGDMLGCRTRNEWG